MKPSDELISYQFFLSTADDESNYFTGEFSQTPKEPQKGQTLSPGKYRVIDGILCRIISGIMK